MLHSPAKILLTVYFFAQTFLGYTQQVPVECTDHIAEQLTARLVPKSLGELFKTIFIVQRERWDAYFFHYGFHNTQIVLADTASCNCNTNVCKVCVCRTHTT